MRVAFSQGFSSLVTSQKIVIILWANVENLGPRLPYLNSVSRVLILFLQALMLLSCICALWNPRTALKYICEENEGGSSRVAVGPPGSTPSAAGLTKGHREGPGLYSTFEEGFLKQPCDLGPMGSVTICRSTPKLNRDTPFMYFLMFCFPNKALCFWRLGPGVWPCPWSTLPSPVPGT